MKKLEMAAYIDHTLLRAFATKAEIELLCNEARQNSFASVCVNPSYVKMCAELLKDSPVKVCTVIGFPLGANTSKIKALETEIAIQEGAMEIDMVINIGALKSQNFDQVEEDIKSVVAAARGKVVKVIIETCYLANEEKIRACELATKAGASFVKTSTGFGTAGATREDVELMRAHISPTMQVKASGGIRTLEQAEEMISSGASRIGTSSGLKFLENLSE